MAITRLPATALSGTSLPSTITSASGITTGKVLQVQTTVTTTTSSTNSTSFTDITNHSVNITPSSSSSKVLVMITFGARVMSSSNQGAVFDFKVLRDSTGISEFRLGNREANNEQRDMHTPGYHVVDQPSTNSQVTYKLQMKKINGDQVQINDGSKQAHITAIEIEG
jgi:hypothetical protein